MYCHWRTSSLSDPHPRPKHNPHGYGKSTLSVNFASGLNHCLAGPLDSDLGVRLVVNLKHCMLPRDTQRTWSQFSRSTPWTTAEPISAVHTQCQVVCLLMICTYLLLEVQIYVKTAWPTGEMLIFKVSETEEKSEEEFLMVAAAVKPYQVQYYTPMIQQYSKGIRYSVVCLDWHCWRSPSRSDWDTADKAEQARLQKGIFWKYSWGFPTTCLPLSIYHKINLSIELEE